MVTKYGPPYFYVGLAEDELKDPENRPEGNTEESAIEQKIGRPLTLTERRILAKFGIDELRGMIWELTRTE